MFISLGLSLSTSMRMINSIHCHTSHSRTYSKPSLTTSLTIPHMLMSLIAHDTNRRTDITFELSNFSTLKPADYPFTIEMKDSTMSSSCPTQLCALRRCNSESEHNSVFWNHT